MGLCFNRGIKCPVYVKRSCFWENNVTFILDDFRSPEKYNLLSCYLLIFCWGNLKMCTFEEYLKFLIRVKVYIIRRIFGCFIMFKKFGGHLNMMAKAHGGFKIKFWWGIIKFDFECIWTSLKNFIIFWKNFWLIMIMERKCCHSIKMKHVNRYHFPCEKQRPLID